jgi:carbonic anhydrase
MRRISLLVLVTVAACGSPSAPESPAASPPASAAPVTKAAAHAHWGYAAEDGPGKWSALDPAFGVCASGQKQSPIDLPATAPTTAGAPALMPQLRPTPFPLGIVDNGHTIQVNGDGKSTAELAGTSYSFAQFHFHVPSEHTIAGKTFDAELHAVHKSADGKLFVVGVLFSKGAENAALAPVFAAMPLPPPNDERKVPGASIDLAAIIGAKPRLYRYEGSLTTPPCSEGVQWAVVDPSATPATMSAAQLAELARALHGDNHRPPQPLGARSVVTVGP